MRADVRTTRVAVQGGVRGVDRVARAVDDDPLPRARGPFEADAELAADAASPAVGGDDVPGADGDRPAIRHL